MVSHSLKSAMLLFIVIQAFIATSSHAANISARTDRVNITINESFTLIFESSGSVDDDPDFSPLTQDFEILNNSENNNISLINGQMQRRVSWTLQLFPKRSGKLLIPAISFGKDKSPELQISVANTPNKARSDQDIYIEVDAEPKSPYIQQQVFLTVRLYRAVATSNDRLSEPELGNQDAVLNKFGEDRSYDKIIDGRRFVIYERQYVIFPQQAGILNIPPIQYSGVTGRSSRGFFDPFGASGKAVRSLSKAIQLNVQAIPPNFKGQHWLPASKVTLNESWSPNPPQFKVGEPVTRNIIITAEGLTAAQLPELPTGNIAGFKQYPDQPGLDDRLSNQLLIGQRIEKVALIPTAAGQYTLPEITIPWWNTQTQKQEIARLPAKTVQVIAAATNSPIDNATNNSAATKAQTANDSSTQIVHETSAGIWPWLCLLFIVAWLVTLFFLLRLKQQLQEQAQQNIKKKPQRSAPNAKQALRQLELACSNNQAQAAKQALLHWAESKWPEHRITSLNSLSRYMDKALQAEIQQLSQSLYHSGPEYWAGSSLWQAFKAWQPISTDNSKEAEPLAPLHKI